MSSFLPLAADADPAGGAAIDQVVIATGGAGVAMALLLWAIGRHRAGRTSLIAGPAAFAERATGLPAWASLPAIAAGLALPVALLGMMWDIALHIDDGRDAGPLANPAHYLILIGLYGVFACGVLSMAMSVEKPSPTAVKVGPWHAPVGGLLIAACGGFALIGFPLDDVWHRLFGQDVTLWGPTHMMLIGGAGLTLVGQGILLAEGHRAARAGATAEHAARAQGVVMWLRRAALMGGLLIGLSTFQAEFDFGVPQFRAVFQPMLIALAAGMALVAARMWVGPGGALAAAVFFFVVRGVIALTVGVPMGETMPAQPLYLVEAALVEVVALWLGTQRIVRFGAVAGLAIGTVGLAAEWAWTQVAYRLPWTADLLPEAVVYAVVAGVAGGLLGAMLAGGLLGSGLPRHARALFAGSLAAVALLVADGLWTENPQGVRAEISRADGGRLEVRLQPANAAEDAAWLTATAWQGGGMVVSHLERTAEGTYRSKDAIPLDGDWKALVRLHDGRTLVAAPVFLPEDAGIPAEEVPGPTATASVTRALGPELPVLQRERKEGGGVLWLGANLLVLGCFLTFFGLLAWGVGRVAGGDRSAGRPPAAAEPAAPRRRPVPA